MLLHVNHLTINMILNKSSYLQYLNIFGVQNKMNKTANLLLSYLDHRYMQLCNYESALVLLGFPLSYIANLSNDWLDLCSSSTYQRNHTHLYKVFCWIFFFLLVLSSFFQTLHAKWSDYFSENKLQAIIDFSVHQHLIDKHRQ